MKANVGKPDSWFRVIVGIVIIGLGLLQELVGCCGRYSSGYGFLSFLPDVLCFQGIHRERRIATFDVSIKKGPFG